MAGVDDILDLPLDSSGPHLSDGALKVHLLILDGSRAGKDLPLFHKVSEILLLSLIIVLFLNNRIMFIPLSHHWHPRGHPEGSHDAFGHRKVILPRVVLVIKPESWL
jgi:hypothetical protein